MSAEIIKEGVIYTNTSETEPKHVAANLGYSGGKYLVINGVPVADSIGVVRAFIPPGTTYEVVVYSDDAFFMFGRMRVAGGGGSNV